MNLTDVYAVNIGRKKAKRVGRGTGSGHGKTSTRGAKGQRARKGYSIRDTFEGGQTPFFRRLPKRGFSNVKFATRYSIVNIADLNELQDVSEVSAKVLLEKGLLRKVAPAGIKVLADGELSRPLTVKAAKFSKRAVEKIQAAGGKTEVV